MKYLIALLLLSSSLAFGEVQLGPNGVWYGNICFNQYGWTFVPWQPIGSTCVLPNRTIGVILNR